MKISDWDNNGRKKNAIVYDKLNTFRHSKTW
jgi:hypothetical protein